MVHGVVALQEGYGIITDVIQRIDCGKCLCDATCIILLYCLCGTVGPWVKVPTALKEDTPMWVYEVGLALGFNSLKTQGWSYPWVLVPKDTGLVLSLGMSPKRHGV